MRLTLVNRNDIAIGKPLPWQLYDKEHRVLVKQGSIIRDSEHLGKLLANGIYRDLSRETVGGRNHSSAAQASSSQTKAGEIADPQFTFDDLKLKTESRLQFEPAAQLSHECYFVKVIGYLKGASLLVTAPVAANGARPELKEGLKIAIRSFSGQNAFGFSCTVKRIVKSHHEYLHLSFPDSIQGVVVRKATRIKTRIISAVQNGNSPDAGAQASALISNISANGVALDSRHPLGKKGDILNLAFRVNLHNIDAFLSVKGEIRAVIRGEDIDTPDPEITRYGIEFQDLQPNDMVILQSMIYHQIIENPHQIV